MKETTVDALRRITNDEIPGSTIELGPNGRNFRIALDGVTISHHPSVLYVSDFDGYSDHELRKFVLTACPGAARAYISHS